MINNYKRNPRIGMKSVLSASVAMSAFALGAGQAVAQDEAGADTARLSTITVTGTKREQTLQDTPVAISVVGAEDIQRAEIQDLSDLQTLVPSLAIRQSQSSSNTNFFIRGFGNGANNIGLEPSVGIFIDGVFRSRAAAYIPDLPNLERVEVLRGPQSTLFGKNASAGVISVVTRGPQFETQGNIEASLGNFDSRRLKGNITGPITDKVAYSLSGSFNQRDGYIDDIGNGEDYNARDRWGIRGELLFKPSDTFEARLIADYDEIDEACCALLNIVEDEEAGAAVAAAGGNVVSEDPFSYEVFFNDIPSNEIENAGLSLQADWDLGFATLTSITAQRTSEDSAFTDADSTDLAFISSDVNTEIDTFTQEIRLTSNASDARFDWMVGAYYFDETIEQDNQVLFGEDYRAFAGALLGDGNIAVGEAQLQGLEAASGSMPGTTFAQAGQGSTEDFQQDNQSWSLFGTVDFHVTERLTATFGLNYTEDEKDVAMDLQTTDALALVNIDQLGYNAAVLGGVGQATLNPNVTPTDVAVFAMMNPAGYAQIQQGALATAQGENNPFGELRALQIFPVFLGFPNAVEDGQSNDSDTTYTFRLAYDVNDNVNVYGTWATGFKATSWNLQRQSKPFSAELGSPPLNPVVDPFLGGQVLFTTPSSPIVDAGLFTTNLEPGTRFADPEQSEVFELGVKMKFDNVAVNVAVFEQTIENFQTTVFIEDAFVFQNADEQSTVGFEFDTTWSPIKPLTLTFAGTLLDAEYDSFPNFGPGIDISGQTPAGVAENQFSVGGNYNFRIADMGAFVRADWQYIDDSNFFDSPADQAAVAAAGYSREQNLVNASTGIMTENGVAVTLWARNLFDDEFLVGAATAVAQAGSYTGIPSQPRTYGVTVRKSF